MDQSWVTPPASVVPAALTPHVRASFGYAAHGLVPGVHRGLPSPWLTMVFSIGQPLRTAPDEAAWHAGVRDPQWVVLGGLHTHAAMVEQPGRWAGVQLALHPLAARGLLGVPTADLPTDRWDAGDLFGLELDRVVEELHEAATWPERYDAVHRFLLRSAARHVDQHSPPSPEMTEAWRLLTRRGESVSVAEVADRVGYSRRRLGQLFAAEVGRAPKTIGRLARFDAARSALSARRTESPALATVAARCGYYDQSHLVRDFRDFVGLAPTEWATAEFPNVQASASTDPAA